MCPLQYYLTLQQNQPPRARPARDRSDRGERASRARRQPDGQPPACLARPKRRTGARRKSGRSAPGGSDAARSLRNFRVGLSSTSLRLRRQSAGRGRVLPYESETRPEATRRRYPRPAPCRARSVCERGCGGGEECRAFAEADPALAERLAVINAKIYVTVPEAALLLGCSDSHLYKLISEAERQERKRPIPYLDLDGVKVLPRLPLLDWARPKRLRAIADGGGGMSLVNALLLGVHSAPDFRRSLRLKGATA